MPPICPQCGNADSSQPIRAIVSAQTTHAVGVTNSVGVAWGRGGSVPVTSRSRTSTTARTGLAGMLYLPSGRPSPAMWIIGIILLVLALIVGSVLFLASISSKPVAHSPLPPAGMAALVGVIPTVGLWLPGVILTPIGLRRRRRYKREAPLRDRMAGLWHQAAYCHRDDVVYLPDGTWAIPQAFRAMLRAEAGG